MGAALIALLETPATTTVELPADTDAVVTEPPAAEPGTPAEAPTEAPTEAPEAPPPDAEPES